VSLSLPKTAKRYGGGKVSNWLWNLLPDNDRVLERIANEITADQKKVSARNPLALLAKVGEDCAGAIQLVRPERLASIDAGYVEWLDVPGIAARLADLRQNRGATGRLPNDKGHFSLPGVQPKTALHRVGDAYGIHTFVLYPG
jgi:serine/threonine-protein kinase HipA